MTSKQRSYIQTLIARKHGHQVTHSIPAGLKSRYNLTRREANMQMTKAEASRLIDQLLAA